MLNLKPLLLPVAAMTLIVVASNILVQHPFPFFGLEDDLTWGAFIYPAAFFVTDLTNRRYGNGTARKLVAAGFIIAIGLSFMLAPPRIAFASGTAYLVGELLDISVFNRLRRQSWWHAPLAASMIGSAIDTALFFSIAFAGTSFMAGPVPFALMPNISITLWQNLAFWDFVVKCGFALISLAPYGALLRAIRPVELVSGEAVQP
eukprot:gene14305-14428_t